MPEATVQTIETIIDEHKIGNKQRFYVFLLAMFFILLIESTMGYYFPVVVENYLKSNFLTGSIIGLTNLVALSCDIIFPRIFKTKTWKFLLLAAVIIQCGYPFFTNLGIIAAMSWLFVVAAIFWNLYFEFLAFSRNNFLISNEKSENFARDWALISLIASITSVVSPMIGASLVRTSMSGRISFFMVVQVLVFITVLYLIFTSPTKEVKEKHKHANTIKLSILREMNIWEVLSVRIIHVLAVGTMVTLMFSAFSTVSGLLGAELFEKEGLEWMIAFIYNVPIVLVSLLFSRFSPKKKKKLWSQICLLLSALSLMLIYLFRDSLVLVVSLFTINSLFVTVAWIFNEAVYSDLGKRSGENNLYLNGMERVNDSIGYLIGPILIGFLSDRVGYFAAFGIIGIIIAVVSIVLLIVTPRKILIPHKELEKIQRKRKWKWHILPIG